MIDLKRQIAKLEERIASKGGDAITSINLGLRCWQAFRFSEDENKKQYLQRANHTVIAAHRRNTAHLDLYALAIFIAIEGGHYDSANEMLDKAMSYRSFLRSNAPFYYGILCFLYAYLEIGQKRTRSARKHWRALSSISDKSDKNPDYLIMHGLLHLQMEEFNEAFNSLTEALRLGSNSMFLYEGLYRYYCLNQGGGEGVSILPVLIYAAKRGAEVSDLAARYQETLLSAVATHPDQGEKLYELSSFHPMLKAICAYYIEQGDLGPKAYGYYKDAVQKQVFTHGIYRALVQGAYVNKETKINHFPMSRFLSDPMEMDLGMSVYVYHMLLTDPDFEDLLPTVQSKILQIGAKCIESGIKSREAMSIYSYYWKRCNALGITGTDVDKIEELLSKNLTLFVLTKAADSLVTLVYITEQEKRGTAEYEFLPESNSIIIEAVSENATYTCLGATRRTILDERLGLNRMVAQAGAELYRYFFDKGDRRFHVLAFLSNHYFSLEEIPDEATSVFEAILAAKGVAKPYRNRVLAALGQLHYNAFSFDDALECYAQINEESLGKDFVPQILGVYLKTREFARASRLLVNKYNLLDADDVFEAFHLLMEKPNESEALVEIGYRLLVKGFFSEEMLKLVTDNYQASYAEWTKLARVLDEDNRSNPVCDAKLLASALEMSAFDIDSQRAFVKLYKSPSGEETNHLLSDFVELAIYRMIISQARPEYDVIDILEKYALRDRGDDLLLWALAGVYLRFNVTTFKSEEVLQLATESLERNSILFSVFKEKHLTKAPFMEKYQPFEYRTQPGKDCWLYFRFEEDSAFASIPMRYLCYGIYIALIPVFYGETITYYFSEELASGSVTTPESSIKNMVPFLLENPGDKFFTLNNAIIYEQLFKHERVEGIISGLIQEVQPVRSALM